MKIWIGRSIMLIASLHTVVGIYLFRFAIADIIGEGVYNTVDGHQDREVAFWFLVCGLFWFLFGGLIDTLENRGFAFPAFLGFGLLALAAFCALLMPVSGFWLLFVPAFGMLLNRQADRTLAEKNP